MAIDEVRIWVKAGDGGKPCSSVYKNRYMRHPRPDGGCGGKGGDVILEADPSLNTLRKFHFQQHFKAPSGKHGGSNRKKGADGEDLVIKVPVGTLVRDAQTGKLLKDLAQPGQRVVVARGGKGGIGNAYTKDHSVVPAQPGQERELILELKYLADVGIVGLPSAGKSTLLNALTGAGSETGSYHFTTRNPVLGTLPDLEVVMADLPGIIEGAHEGKGLGDRFLKHIERAKVLLHVVDISGSEGRLPWEDYIVLNEELRKYNPALLAKPQIVVLNKKDLLTDMENVKRFEEFTGVKDFVLVSAMTGEGLDELRRRIAEELERIRYEEGE